MWYAFRGVLQKENLVQKQKLEWGAVFFRKGVRGAGQGSGRSKARMWS